MARRPLIAVYMEASRPFGVIYTGVTSNLFRRGHQHLDGTGSAFAAIARDYLPDHVDFGPPVGEEVW